jgi:molybdenum cofactor biosynthesis enzyme MoaA
MWPAVYDFANLLFAGPCNRSCPWCIGKSVPERANVANLDRWPLGGIEEFVALIDRERIRQVVLTGTTSDPQLYRHEARLLAWLRARLHPETAISVHTNGVLALAKLDVFKRYDRASISLPSLVPATYREMMGSPRVPDLAAILRSATIPVKVSALVSEHNWAEMDDFVAACHAGLELPGQTGCSTTAAWR